MNWDDYFVDIAEAVRHKSKDPNTQIGAVLVGPEHNIVSTGFNGFPRGVLELDPVRWERPIKYQYVEHAERNAIYNAARYGIKLAGCTLYLAGMGPPTAPCVECTKGVIQAGIFRVVGKAYKPIPDETREKWEKDFEFSLVLMEEAGVIFNEWHT